MLANRLKILLAERDLSIKDVVNATGLTRPSVSNMVNNPLANISTDNVDKLCNYLGVKPSEFYDYLPWRFDFELQLGTMKINDLYHKPGESKSGELDISYISGSIQQKTTLNFVTHIKADYADPIDKYDLYMQLSNLDGDDQFTDIFKKMSPFFKHYIQQKMVLSAQKVIETKDKNNEFDKLISKSDDKLEVSVTYLSGDDEPLLQTSFTYKRKLKQSSDEELAKEALKKLKTNKLHSSRNSET